MKRATHVPSPLFFNDTATTEIYALSLHDALPISGQTSGTIMGTILDDNLFDTANRTLTLTLGSPTNATLASTTSNTLTINRDGAPPPTRQISAANDSVSVTTSTFSITVTQSAATE